MPQSSHHHFTLHSTKFALLFYNNLTKNKKTYKFFQLLFKCARMPSNATRSPPIPALSHSNSSLFSHIRPFSTSNSPLSSSLTIGPQYSGHHQTPLKHLIPETRTSPLTSNFFLFFLMPCSTSKTKPSSEGQYKLSHLHLFLQPSTSKDLSAGFLISKQHQTEIKVPKQKYNLKAL